MLYVKFSLKHQEVSDAFSVFIGFIGVMILLISSRQTLLTLRADTFRARGDRLIRRTRHPVMFWMNVGGIAVLGIIGLTLICWSILVG
jgi:hypothetical protein